jgi:hypothetical protein
LRSYCRGCRRGPHRLLRLCLHPRIQSPCQRRKYLLISLPYRSQLAA